MKPRYPTIKELASLIVDLKKGISDDYRGSSYKDPYVAETSAIPTMDVTIGWTPDDGSWNYQTGDNS